jgi:hypothetical protein
MADSAHGRPVELHAAAAANELERASALLDSGSSVDARDDEGYTAAIWAVSAHALFLCDHKFPVIERPLSEGECGYQPFLPCAPLCADQP